MARYSSAPRYDRKLGRLIARFPFLALIVLAAMSMAGWFWLQDHPQHNPWAPLDLNHPAGLATDRKLLALRDDVPACRAVFERSDVAITALEPQGEGQCARLDRTRLDTLPLAPTQPATTCPAALALELWRRNALEPVARELFNSEVTEVQHLGVYSCRRLYGRDSGPWSEHATGNAIDIAGFVLADGTQISVLNDWDEGGVKQAFLRRVRDGACDSFSTVLSPDYNAAHRDHFHFDMSDRWTSVCR